MSDDEYRRIVRAIPRPITSSWIRGDGYDALMRRFADGDGGLNEAVDSAASYAYRHGHCGPYLGPWKWRGMHTHRFEILDAIGSDRLVLDFGGACGPLGCDSIVVDVREHDALGRPVRLASFGDILDRCADVVFTSHALEHVEMLGTALAEIARVLRSGGMLIALVPSWQRDTWRVGNLKSELWGDHVWDFGLEPLAPIPLERYVNIAAAIDAHLSVQRAWYCGDNNIMVLARKP